MPRKYDPQSGTITDVASSGPLVALLGPGGEPRQVPAAQAEFFLGSGYQPDTPEARLELQQQAEFGEGLGNELAAGGLGLARSLSFGVSDLALAKTGLVKADTLNQIKERNPNASIAGEIGGLILPFGGQALAGLKGAGALAKSLGGAAQVAGSSVLGVGKVGAAIAEAATKATGSKILGGAAQAAAEGFAYNVAKNLSETVLGDRQVTAERLLANSGQALAVGAGLGIGMPLAGKAVKVAASKAKQSIDTFGGFLKERVLPGVGDAAARGYSAAYGAVSGKGEEAANEVYAMLQGSFKAGPAKEREAFVKAISPEQFDDTLRGFVEQLDDVHRSTKDVIKRGFRDIRPKEVTKLLQDVEMTPALEDFGRLINTARATAKKMADDPLLYDQTYRREMEKIADLLEQRAGSAAGEGTKGFKSAEDLWTAINEIKGTALNDLAYMTNLKAVGRAETNAVMEVRGVYDAFKKHLTDPALYGDAAARQASYNEAFSAHRRLIERKAGKTGDFKRFFLGPEDQVDTAKALKFLRKIGSGRDVEERAALDEFMAASRVMVDETEKSAVNIGAVDAIDRKGFESLVGKLADTTKKASDDLAAVSKIRSQDAFGMALLNFQKSVGDTLFRDGVFSATVNLAQKAASPFGVASALSRAEGLALNTSTRISKAIGGFVERAGEAGSAAMTKARPFTEPASVKILLDGIIGAEGGDMPKGRRGGYNHQIDRLASLTADPAGTAEQLAEGMQAISGAAPELTRATVDLQMRAIQYVYDKAPKNQDTQSTLNPFITEWQPPDYELARWERTVAAVQDPIGVVEDLANGDVSPEGVEALAAVYPSLYEEIRTQLVERVSQLENSMEYHDRIQLSLLFGVNLDPSLQSGFATALQNGYAEAAQQASKSSTAYRPSTAAAKLGALEETPAQRISRR